MMECRCVLLVAVALIPLSYAGLDTSVCTPGQGDYAPNPSTKQFPPVPDVFSARISMNVIANSTTKTLYEVFDSPRNRAKITETEAAGDYKNISLTGSETFNFYSNQIVELIQFIDGSYVCDVSQLDGRGKDTFIFGENAGSTKSFSAKTAFMISQTFPPVYARKQTLDSGVQTEVWRDCHYMTALDATVTAEWYFTDSDTWVSPLGTSQIPVMLKVKGKTYQYDPQGRNIEHTYTFTDFRDFITDDEADSFQIPPGTLCPFMKGFTAGTEKPKTFPAVASNGYMSFRAELVTQTDVDSGLVTDFREFYDSTMMLSRYDYTPQGVATEFFDQNAGHPLTEVHDFLTGLAYKIDRNYGNCTIIPLAKSPSWDVQLDPTDASHVRMKTVKEFFFIDGTESSSTGMNWTYTGTRKMRDILADVFVAERVGWPTGTPADTKSTWEIAFTSPNYLEVASNEAGTIEVQEPIRLWVKIPDVDYEMTYNIFDFDEQEPDAWRYDVSQCFSDDQKTNVNFRLPGDKRDIMETHRKEFTYWLLVDILGYLDLTPIRVSNLEWFADDQSSDIIVQFQLIDPPTIKGSTNDQLPSTYLNPTSDAIDLLKAAVDGGNLVVEVGGAAESDKLQTVTAIKGSVQKGKVVTKTVKVIQLDGGAAAGIAIAFLVAGAGIGILIIFIVNKVRGQNLPNLTMSFTPKTFENSS